MPTIFDNIEKSLIDAFCNILPKARRSDLCVGYFNLRGYRLLAPCVATWEPESGQRLRLLVGMQRPPAQQLRVWLETPQLEIDNSLAITFKRKLAEEFKQQLTTGAPTDADESGLRTLLSHLRSDLLRVKLFLRHPLHAKLYLVERSDSVRVHPGS